MMKILVVCEEGRHYERVVQELRKRNHVDFVFISSRWGSERGDYHVPKLFGRHFGYRFLTFIVVHYLLLTNKYDFCITDYESVFVPLFFTMIKNYTDLIKTKFMHDLRTIPVDHPEYRSKTVERKFLTQLRFANRFYQGISVITEEMRKHIEQKYIHIRKPLCIWESGVDVSIFRPLPKNMNLKRKLGFKDSDFICFYHGDFTDKRGIKELVESFAIIKSRDKMIKLFLLGKGNFYERLQKMIVDLGLDDTIHMHEWVEYNEVPEFISITDLCIVPLPNIDWWRVSSPLKLMEYIACEKNILMTNMIAHTNVVGKNNKYFFVNEITAESLAEEIRKAYKCFKTNPIKYHKGGIAERKKLINIISWENRSKSFEKFLIELNSFGK